MAASESVVVAVADSVHARIFEAQAPDGELREVESLVNEESRMHEGDLVADSAGRVQNRPLQAKHSALGGESAKRHRAEEFAGLACEHIARAVRQGKARRLYLVADPQTLGLLRQRMDQTVRKCVAGEVVKSLATEPPERIREVLPERL